MVNYAQIAPIILDKSADGFDLIDFVLSAGFQHWSWLAAIMKMIRILSVYRVLMMVAEYLWFVSWLAGGGWSDAVCSVWWLTAANPLTHTTECCNL